jgi:Uma2 family endonuclease
MALPFEKRKLTSDEFLAWELNQIERHDFVDGEAYAMSGAGEAHVTVTGNVWAALRDRVRSSGCRAFFTDMKLKVEATGNFFYPDVFVTCGEADRADPLVKREPKLIVEVLSKSTAAYDRGDKFANYRQIPTLKEYALIDPDRRIADVFRLGQDGLWVLHPLTLQNATDTLNFASVNIALTAAEVFADVDVDVANAAA